MPARVNGELTGLSTEADALGLFIRYEFPDWLREHSLVVGRIAGALARSHAQRGARIDPERVALAGYLHDIGKSPLSGDDTRPHNEVSATIVEREGLGDLAELVRRHPVYAPLHPQIAPRDLAERLVYYADRRGERSVVTVDERLAGQASRHPEHAAELARARTAIGEIEAAIFAGLPFGPDELAAQLRPDDLAGRLPPGETEGRRG